MRKQKDNLTGTKKPFIRAHENRSVARVLGRGAAMKKAKLSAVKTEACGKQFAATRKQAKKMQ